MQSNALIGDTKCGRDNWFVSVKEKGLYKFTYSTKIIITFVDIKHSQYENLCVSVWEKTSYIQMACLDGFGMLCH